MEICVSNFLTQVNLILFNFVKRNFSLITSIFTIFISWSDNLFARSCAFKKFFKIYFDWNQCVGENTWWNWKCFDNLNHFYGFMEIWICEFLINVVWNLQSVKIQRHWNRCVSQNVKWNFNCFSVIHFILSRIISITFMMDF